MAAVDLVDDADPDVDEVGGQAAAEDPDDAHEVDLRDVDEPARYR